MTRLAGERRQSRSIVLFVAGMFLSPGGVSAQMAVRDLVFTGGLSGEQYDGNLPAVALPVVDSSDHANAAVGEMGVRGNVLLSSGRGRELALHFDGGMRQFSAGGFRIRDYAPREWVVRSELAWQTALAPGQALQLSAGGSYRNVTDRTPVPLFIEPAYHEWTGRITYLRALENGMRVTADLQGESADYAGIPLLPQLDLLDQRSLSLEVGAEWGGDRQLRVHGAVRRIHFPEQGTFDPEDPFRRDLMLQIGALWALDGPIYMELGADGTLNRSNSRRPEYDAVGVRALVAAPLTGTTSLQLFATLTAKRYTTETPFVRLVPGEEADNASLLYGQVSRALAPNLDAAVRFGWSRAETDFGDSYFRKYGFSVLLNFRPMNR